MRGRRGQKQQAMAFLEDSSQVRVVLAMTIITAKGDDQ